MGVHIPSVEEATKFAEAMAATAEDIGLDGMDLDVEDSGTGAEVQVNSVLITPNQILASICQDCSDKRDQKSAGTRLPHHLHHPCSDSTDRALAQHHSWVCRGAGQCECDGL